MIDASPVPAAAEPAAPTRPAPRWKPVAISGVAGVLRDAPAATARAEEAATPAVGGLLARVAERQPTVAPEAVAPEAAPAEQVRTRADALRVVDDLNAALWQEYRDVLGDPARRRPAGRAFFIFGAHYLPWLRANAENFTPMELASRGFLLVERARTHAATEQAAKAFLDHEQQRGLFPEHHYAQFHAAAVALRAEAPSREMAERWKWEALGDESGFAAAGMVEHWRAFAADLVEAEGLERRAGRGSRLSLKEVVLSARIRGPVMAREAALADLPRYREAEKQRHERWTLLSQAQRAQDLPILKPLPGERHGRPARRPAPPKTVEDVALDLVEAESAAIFLRREAAGKLLPQDVFDAWEAAHEAMLLVTPFLRGRTGPPQDIAGAARAAVKHFYAVAADWATPGIGGPLIDRVMTAANARSVAAWREVAGHFRQAVREVDTRLVRAQRAATEALPKQRERAEQLARFGEKARKLEELHATHPQAQRLNAVFYPLDQLENVGPAGAPRFRAVAIPLTYYLYREKGTWHLVDVNRPDEPRHNTEDGPAGAPPQSLFQQLDSPLRFPKGRLSVALQTEARPVGYSVEISGDLQLSDWLTYIGFGLTALGLIAGAIATAVPTGGASVVATVLIVGSGLVGAAAGVAGLVEKSEQGMLTTTTVVLEVASIVGNLGSAATAGIGKVISIAAKGGTGTLARIAVAVQIARQPALAAGIAGDLTTLAAFSAETWQQYRRLEESTAPDEEKRAAQRRLVALTLANGAMTILAVKGDLKSLGDSPRLVLDFTGPGRIPIARPVLSDPQLRRRLSMVADPEGFIAHLGALDEAARDRVQSQLSLVALSGQLGSPTVKSVLQGASTEQVLRFLELAHIDQHATQVLFQMRRGTVEADWIRSTVLGSDFARARTLIADHGSKLRAGLTWRQYPSLEALERHLANLEQYEPVYKRGVLESVDVDVPPAGWEILDEKMSQRPRPHPVAGGAWEVSARVRGPNGGRGRFSARYHPKTGEFTLKEAFLEERHTGTPAGPVPTFVTGTATPLSARGTPTVIHMVLYLKTVLTNATRKTVPGIQRIRLETVIHLETLLELNWLRRQYRTGLIKEPPSLAERALITKTSTYRYAESAAIQAGLEPVPSSVHVDPAGADTTRLGDVMDQQLGKLTGTRRAEAVEGQDSLVKTYGFTREDQVVERFDIVFDVRPRMPD